jgi:hypothetical protein
MMLSPTATTKQEYLERIHSTDQTLPFRRLEPYSCHW